MYNHNKMNLKFSLINTHISYVESTAAYTTPHIQHFLIFLEIKAADKFLRSEKDLIQFNNTRTNQLHKSDMNN